MFVSAIILAAVLFPKTVASRHYSSIDEFNSTVISSEICNNGIDDDGNGDIDCEDIACGQIINREFENGTANWVLNNSGGNVSTLSIDNGSVLSGEESALVDVTNVSGGSSWKTQLEQHGLSIEAGKRYRIYFDAKSESSRKIRIRIQKENAPFTGYWTQDVLIANGAASFIYEFVATSTDTQVDLTFDLGQKIGKVWIDNVQFKETCANPTCDEVVDDSYAACATSSVSGNVADNDPINDDPFNITYSVTSGPSQGSVVLGQDGSYTYTPAANASGQDEFTYERCFSFVNDHGDENIAFYPCGDGRQVDTYIEGIEGQSNPSISIPDPTNFETIFVEVWAESACGSVSIEGQVAEETDLYRTTGQLDTEKLYRLELSSISSDGVINISKTGTCVLSSVAAYTVRTDATGQGSSTLVQANIDFWHGYVGTDDCQVFTLPLGYSDSSRDITFNIPLHEKDNTRIVTATAVAGFRTGSGSTTAHTGSGSGAGLISITLANVPGDVSMATIEVCSPDGTGDSFGVGIISATNNNCQAETTFDCCSEAVATIAFTAASIVNSDTDYCQTGSSSTLRAELSGNTASSYQWGHTSSTSNQVVVSPTTTTTYYVTITDPSGCESTASSTITVYPPLDVEVDFNGEVCLADDTQLTADVTGGSGSYSYAWSGPNGFSSGGQTINAEESGNYSVTVTDAAGCFSIADGYVYQAFDPYIFSLSQEVCEGESIELSVTGSNLQSYQWDASAGNATTNGVTVTPTVPSSTYVVTVTNNLGCQSTAEVSIGVEPLPIINITGPSTICVDETSTLSSDSDGTWISSNTSVATVSPIGVVTGQNSGSVTFTFLSSTTNCTSNPTSPITVNPKPSVSVTGPTTICDGEQSSLFPSVGGTWTSSNINVATVSSNGIVTAQGPGTASFIFTNSSTQCSSDATEDITVNEVPVISTPSNTTLCIQSSILISSTTSGTWTSSDNGVAVISGGGVVTGISAGTATMTFVSNQNCPASNSIEITVDPQQGVSISGANRLCDGETATLTASLAGGTWSSSAPSIVSINSAGLITAESPGSATITYTSATANCASDATYNVIVDEVPTISRLGNTAICLGETTSFSTNLTGGYWSSNDETVAVISNGGIVTGVNAGSTTFNYTSSEGCRSSNSTTITVHEAVTVSIDFNGSVCLTESSVLTAITSGGSGEMEYQWTGPGGFAESTESISIVLDGNYNLTVTDGNGCTDETTAFVYEAYEPFIFGLSTEVCEGDEVTLSVSGNNVAGYQWSSSAGSSTSQSVTVTPAVPSTDYSVTVTSTLGCTAETTASISVDPKPVISVLGETEICVGATTQLSGTVSGEWSSLNSSVASIDANGLVTGLSSGTVRFRLISASGCISEDSQEITVSPNVPVSISGSVDICSSDNPIYVASVTGGQWTSSNPIVAIINNDGSVVPQGIGFTTLTYTMPTGSCYADANLEIQVNSDPSITINGPATICEGENTYLNASHSGAWTSSDNSIATITSTGIVTAISGGIVDVTFTTTAGCTTTLGSAITVVDRPIVSLLGPDELCIDENTTLSPSSGGIWVSSNTQVATVSSNGIVTAKKAGVALFTFIELTNGCESASSILVTVNGTPSISNPTIDDLCIDETTNIYPSSGGTWQSTNTAVATITSDGEITAVGAGSARFIFTSGNTGCKSILSEPISVYGKPTAIFTGPTSLCVGDFSFISPSSGGSWTSTDVTIATITQQGIIEAHAPGTVRFRYTNSVTGCVSDESELLTVQNPTAITLDGSDRICIGEVTNFSPSIGGTWTSSNTNIATITNTGEVQGVAPGTATFTFNSNTGCNSSESIGITIDANPNPTYLGPNSICLGEGTQLLPTNGGTWSSSNESVATVDDNGTVTSTGSGSTQFSFTSNLTGCSTVISTLLNVYERPDVEIAGDSEICIGELTYMTPSSGGAWVSSNPNIASISPNGTVIGISQGTVQFTYFENGSSCESLPSSPVTILPTPSVSITGDNTLCIGETSQLSPTSGGSWISSNPSVATVTNSGLVTAAGQGIVRFSFVSNAGCQSNDTAPIIVYGRPTVVVNGDGNLCIGEELQMLPSTGGTWTSSNEDVATIDDSGVVTALATGAVTFAYTDSNTGCTSAESDFVLVNPVPEIDINGPSDICIGGVTYLTPSAGGVWMSVDPSIATIQNNGQITGVSPGEARFIFTDLISGCLSDTSQYITINAGPATEFTGDTDICIGETTQVTPSSGGTWISLDPQIATITDAGVITGVSTGITRFQFTDDASGCKSAYTSALLVNGPPVVSVAGNSTICIGSTTDLSPSSGGEWVSLNTDVATVSSSGVVTAVSEGVAYFRFTDSMTGCTSDGTLNVSVSESITVAIEGDTELCAGYTMQLSPSSGGFWTSSNPTVASVSNSGIVRGLAPGKAAFTFVDASTGCSAGGTTDEITVSDCLFNDFNVALVDQEITGDVQTNDRVSSPSYSPFVSTVSKPLASLATLVVASDGTYTFEGNTPGKYIYNIAVCEGPLTSGCPTSILEITVLDNVYGQSNPLANLEFVTTYTSTDPMSSGDLVTVSVLANDDCVYTAGCDLDPATLSITGTPGNGVATVVGTDIIYTPNPGFVGHDTIFYEVCEDGDATNCSETAQIITVSHTSADNSIDAADDFAFTLRGNPVSGSVMTNDHDAEGHSLSVVPQGSLMVPVTMPQGSYYIDAAGVFVFTPDDSFSGAVDIVYTVCDDATTPLCTDATIHIQVFDDLQLSVKVFLEGALMETGNQTSTQGRPIMRDDLRNNPFNGSNSIPIKDPYQFPVDYLDATPTMFGHVGPGLMAINTEIPNPTNVFAVTGDDAIVDWIHVEIRDKNNYLDTIATRAGLLQRDGDVVDLDGVSPLRFNGVNIDQFYVVVKHRTHLGVMSMLVDNGEVVDFTDPSTATFNFGTTLNPSIDYTGLSQNTNVRSGFAALWAGDMNSDGAIKFTEPFSDQNILYGDVLFSSAPLYLINYDFTLGYYRGDYNMNGKAKFINPDDDTNLLFTQVVLYPLNNNLLANYGNIIEQVPNR